MGINCYSIYLKTPFILLSEAAQTTYLEPFIAGVICDFQMLLPQA